MVGFKCVFVFFCKQKTAYEMRISDWSSDVCSSDLFIANRIQHALAREAMSLLEKGIASAEDIDEVVKWSLGIRLALTGPMEQRDMNGLDVHHAIATYLYPDLAHSTKDRKSVG